MLQPKRTKFRKQFKLRNRGLAITGSSVSFGTFGLKSVEENSLGLKDIRDSLNIRHMMLQNLEQAAITCDDLERDALTNFVIVGGGPTGVETAGALAELKLHVLPNDYPDLDLSKMQINIIERAPRLLNGMSEQASKRATDFLIEMGVQVRTNDSVKS